MEPMEQFRIHQVVAIDDNQPLVRAHKAPNGVEMGLDVAAQLGFGPQHPQFGMRQT